MNLIFGSLKKDTNPMNPLSTHKSQKVKASAKEQAQANQKSLFMNSYLMKSGVLLRTPVSPAVVSDDFTLIHEVDNFIAQF